MQVGYPSSVGLMEVAVCWAAVSNATGSKPIAKAVVYYPVCRGPSPWSPMGSGLMPLGGADDIALPAMSNAVTKGVPPERLTAITYPNARLGFGMRGLLEAKAHG